MKRLVSMVVAIAMILGSMVSVYANDSLDLKEELAIEKTLFKATHPTDNYDIKEYNIFNEGNNTYVISKEYDDNCVDLYLVKDGNLISQYFVDKNSREVVGKNINGTQLERFSLPSAQGLLSTAISPMLSAADSETYARVNITYYDDMYYPQGTRSFAIWGNTTYTDYTTYNVTGVYQDLLSLISFMIAMYNIPAAFSESIASGIRAIYDELDPTNSFYIPDYIVACSSIEVTWEGKDLQTGVVKQFSGTKYTSHENGGATTRNYYSGVYYPIESLRNRNVAIPMEINNMFYHSFDISVNSWQDVR